jgi:hypothetical protein
MQSIQRFIKKTKTQIAIATVFQIAASMPRPYGLIPTKTCGARRGKRDQNDIAA